MATSRSTRKSTRNTKKVTFAQVLKKSNTCKKKATAIKKKKLKKKITEKSSSVSVDAESFLGTLVSTSTVLNNRSMSTEQVLKFTGNTKGYDCAKDKNLLLFWWTMRQNKELEPMSQIGKTGKYHFFELTADKRSNAVKSIINIAMVNWVLKLVKKKYRNNDIDKMTDSEFASAQYKPNCIQLFDSMLFSSLRKNVSYL